MAPSEQEQQALSLDDVLEHHVGTGWGQALQTLLVSMSYLPEACTILLMVFTTVDPVQAGAWGCVNTPAAAPTSNTTLSPAPSAQCLAVKSQDGLTSMDPAFCALPRDQWAWTDPGGSVISTFDLTCGRAWQVTLLNSAFFLALIAGGLCFGYVADRVGRKPAIYAAGLLCGAMTAVAGLAPWFGLHFAARTLSALGTQGLSELDIVLCTEPVAPSARGKAGIATQLMYIVGECLLAGLAWAFRGWRALTLAVAGTSIVFLATFPWVHESPRWLLLHRRHAQAHAVLGALAAANRRHLTAPTWEALLRTYERASALAAAALAAPAGPSPQPGADVEVDVAGAGGKAGALKELELVDRLASGGSVRRRLAAQHAADGETGLLLRGILLSSPDASVSIPAHPAGAAAGDVLPGAAARAHCGGAGPLMGADGAEPAPSLVSGGRSGFLVGLGPPSAPGLAAAAAVLPTPSLGADGAGGQGHEHAPYVAEAPPQQFSQIEVLSPWRALRRSALLRRYCGLLAGALVALQLSYYGAQLAASALGGSVQLNFLLLALAELPSTLLVAACVDVVGRVALLVAGVAMAAGTCAALGLVSSPLTLQVGIAMLSKFASSAAWATLLVYASEVIPTCVRSSLSGAVAQLGCLGGFVAPYLYLAANQHGQPALPFFVMAACTGLAAVGCAWLPETCGHPQPESLQDMHSIAKSTVRGHLRGVWARVRQRRR